MWTQKYVIQLTPAGKVMYAQRDTDLERGVCFLIERIGTVEWARRSRAIHDRYMKKLKATVTPDEGISVRDREDEIGWYLFLGETLIANPVAVDSDQANRVAPYLSAFGRKLDAILSIGGVEALLDRLVRRVKDQDPDQVLFEIFVGAAYVLDGWSVDALPTQSSKTPDFEINREARRFEVECKRLTRRAGYSEKERDSWLRLWKPVSQWLIAEKRSLIFSMTFHTEMQSLPVDYLMRKIKEITTELERSRQFVEIGVVSIHAEAVDYERINRDLRESYVKVGSPRERFVVSGRYERDMGFTCAIGGRPVTIGPATIAGNRYWDSIEFVTGSYWRCDASAALDAKSRDIMKRLSEAASQLTGRLPGIAHCGIESESDVVELLRASKIRSSIERFDTRGQPLEWIYVHNFRGESLPDGTWAMDETCDWNGAQPEFFRPLVRDFLVIPDDAPSREGRHFDPPNG